MLSAALGSMRPMETGVLVGRELRFSEDERAGLMSEAARLGYTSAWTNSGPDVAGVESCRRWFKETGLTTGIAVVPTPTADVDALGSAARALGEASQGRFILGIGAGSMISPAWRAKHGLADKRPVGLMREHLVRLKEAARVPLYLGALGPRMLHLVGELADGALPNWMDPSQLAWARQQVAVGARAAGRDPASITIGQSVRVAVDADPDVARVALAKSSLGYSLARPDQPGGGHYRRAMARMGLDEDLKKLEAMRDRGASEDEIAAAFPEPALRRLGAWGPPAEAAAAFKHLSEGLDIAIVRVVTARPGLDAARAVIRACAPG
jgi:alkanesulfonate monooxygenase SsuD/methylene tetrahydromethanopterin reductase-like flavin-dependent oxidoreductase (luciferase family)